MTSLKRTDSKTSKETPPRCCVACTEDETTTKLIRPCRCSADYCIDCLIDMFTSATTDRTRMPPHCCSLIQIHAILGQLTFQQAKDYRAKFEEWITPVKTYCPAPTCSAFISERRVPAKVEDEGACSLTSILGDIVSNVLKHSSARFFRGEMDMTLLPEYTAVVKRPIDLNTIQGHVGQYKTLNDLTHDMQLIVSNASNYNKMGHPVTEAANELFSSYIEEISNATGRLLTAKTAPTLFACEKCHTAICASCKEIEHTGSPCDTISGDREAAMLLSFGYKRCPRCKAGVKKMFGCSHMQCLCGAHWCWYCQKSLDECGESCDEAAEAGDSEMEDDDDDDGDGEEEAFEPVSAGSNEAVDGSGGPSEPRAADVTTGGVSRNRVVNLDAGGDRRWAGTDNAFGDEPDEPFVQIWSCNHNFDAFKVATDDGYNHGDLSLVECNRCFGSVEAQQVTTKPVAPKKKKIGKGTRGNAVALKSDDVISAPVLEKEAWECKCCRLVVCVSCRDEYKAAQKT